MVLHNPGNWHWVNKDARDWTLDYFKEHLPGLSVEKDGVSAKIDKVLSVEGDVDVSQRKGKVISIFDVKVRLEYSGKASDGTEASGTIAVPEVAHDTEHDEYQFEITNYSDSKEKQPVRDLIRTQLTPKLRDAFAKFGDDLITEHGKDLQHPDGAPPGIKPTPPRPSSAASSSASKPAAKPAASSSSSSGKVVNTTTITETYEFQAPAEQLYITFTDRERVQAFTRAPIQAFEPKTGGEFSLFGGNVQGKFETLNSNKEIIQKWRLAAWPQGHYSTQRLVFDQGTGSTVLRLTWEGVPIGQEDVAKANFHDYYVLSIKTTFGFGAVL